MHNRITLDSIRKQRTSMFCNLCGNNEMILHAYYNKLKVEIFE